MILMQSRSVGIELEKVHSALQLLYFRTYEGVSKCFGTELIMKSTTTKTTVNIH